MLVFTKKILVLILYQIQKGVIIMPTEMIIVENEVKKVLVINGDVTIREIRRHTLRDGIGLALLEIIPVEKCDICKTANGSCSKLWLVTNYPYLDRLKYLEIYRTCLRIDERDNKSDIAEFKIEKMDLRIWNDIFVHSATIFIFVEELISSKDKEYGRQLKTTDFCPFIFVPR